MIQILLPGTCCSKTQKPNSNFHAPTITKKFQSNSFTVVKVQYILTWTQKLLNEIATFYSISTVRYYSNSFRQW